MRRSAACLTTVLVVFAGCSGDDNVAEPTGDSTRSGESSGAGDSAPADSATPTAPAPPTAPATSVPFEPEPFEPQPTTPVQAGDDLDEILREAAATTTTTIVLDPALPPPVAPLQPGPLAWVERVAPDPASDALHLLVDEGGCDGAVDVADRLSTTVTETPGRVLVGVERIGDAPADREPCPTEPLTPVTITLDAPLGERSLRAIDGSLSPVPIPFVPEPVAVRSNTDQSPVLPASSRSTSAAPEAFALDCDTPSWQAVDWRPTTEFLAPSVGLAEGAAEFGHSDAPWHETRRSDRVESLRWSLFVAGRAVANISARPGLVGLRFDGEACPSVAMSDLAGTAFDERPPPNATAAGPPESAPLLDLRTAPGGDLFDVDDAGQLRFPDPTARCVTWVTWEDALLDAGYVLGPTSAVLDRAAVSDSAGTEPGTLAAIPRQARRRIDAPDGSVAVVTTTLDGMLLITEGTADADARARPSRLSPCSIDDTVSVVWR